MIGCVHTLQILPIWNGKALVQGHKAALIPATELALSEDQETYFLGETERGEPLFALEAQEDCTITTLSTGTGADFRYIDLRNEGPELPHEDAALLGLAQSIVCWNKTQVHNAYIHFRNRIILILASGWP